MTDSEAAEAPRPPLISIKGDATPEEVAAVVAVFQALAATSGSQTQAAKPKSHRSDPTRMHRRPLSHGPGGWWSSGLPR